MSSELLPQGFATLEPFVDYWAAPSLSARDTRRLDSTAEQRLAFYAAGKALAPEAMAYLDSKPLSAFDAADHRLLELLLALTHVALAVEVQGDEEPIHAQGARRMPIGRERPAPRYG